MVRLKGLFAHLAEAIGLYFNSSMVRLKVVSVSRADLSAAIFQFQYGAIEGLVYENVIDAAYVFQFQYGAIEGREWVLQPGFRLPNFNSSMVRLKVLQIVFFTVDDHTFQFQYGAIEGDKLTVRMVATFLFQFQYGAIEGILVPCVYVVVFSFQFQYGAIEGYWPEIHRFRLHYFNSSMVRLKVEVERELNELKNNFNSSMVRLKVQRLM